MAAPGTADRAYADYFGRGEDFTMTVGLDLTAFKKAIGTMAPLVAKGGVAVASLAAGAVPSLGSGLAGPVGQITGASELTGNVLKNTATTFGATAESGIGSLSPVLGDMIHGMRRLFGEERAFAKAGDRLIDFNRESRKAGIVRDDETLRKVKRVVLTQESAAEEADTQARNILAEGGNGGEQHGLQGVMERLIDSVDRLRQSYEFQGPSAGRSGR